MQAHNLDTPITLIPTPEAGDSLTRVLRSLVREHDSEKASRAAKTQARTELLAMVGDSGSDHVVDVDGDPRTVTIVPPPKDPRSTDTAKLAKDLQTARKLATKASLDLSQALAKSDPEALAKVAARIVATLAKVGMLCEVPTKPRKASPTVRVSG